jgi:hypothetical protein
MKSGGSLQSSKSFRRHSLASGCPAEEFQNSDGRYIVTFDGSVDGNLMQVAILVTENTDKKIESIRLFARPWPVVKLFRDFMGRHLRPDPVPDAIWNLPAA